MCLYILNIFDGSLEWKFEANDVIKSSPFVNLVSGYIYFGSHDKNLYCLDLVVFFF